MSAPPSRSAARAHRSPRSRSNTPVARSAVVESHFPRFRHTLGLPEPTSGRSRWSEVQTNLTRPNTSHAFHLDLSKARQGEGAASTRARTPATGPRTGRKTPKSFLTTYSARICSSPYSCGARSANLKRHFRPDGVAEDKSTVDNGDTPADYRVVPHLMHENLVERRTSLLGKLDEITEKYRFDDRSRQQTPPVDKFRREAIHATLAARAINIFRSTYSDQKARRDRRNDLTAKEVVAECRKSSRRSKGKIPNVRTLRALPERDRVALLVKARLGGLRERPDTLELHKRLNAGLLPSLGKISLKEKMRTPC